MRVRSRWRPRYLIQKRKVSADYAIGLIVVVKAQNGKLVNVHAFDIWLWQVNS